MKGWCSTSTPAFVHLVCAPWLLRPCYLPGPLKSSWFRNRSLPGCYGERSGRSSSQNKYPDQQKYDYLTKPIQTPHSRRTSFPNQVKYYRSYLGTIHSRFAPVYWRIHIWHRRWPRLPPPTKCHKDLTLDYHFDPKTLLIS